MTNLSDAFTPEQRKANKAKIVDNNTFRYTSENGDTVYRLHNTDVVRVRAQGGEVLNSGGYKTVTTKDRINRFSKYQLVSTKGVWYVVSGDKKVPFYDGIVLPDAFEASEAKQEKLVKKQESLRKAITKFVAEKIVDGERLPEPNNGDCFFCNFSKDANTGKIATTALSQDHLLSHVKEKYMHGSLIVLAMRWAGYTPYRIALAFRETEHKEVRRTLRRFLGRQLGLAV
jgi:hypothetical protein